MLLDLPLFHLVLRLPTVHCMYVPVYTGMKWSGEEARRGKVNWTCSATLMKPYKINAPPTRPTPEGIIKCLGTFTVPRHTCPCSLPHQLPCREVVEKKEKKHSEVFRSPLIVHVHLCVVQMCMCLWVGVGYIKGIQGERCLTILIKRKHFSMHICTKRCF